MIAVRRATIDNDRLGPFMKRNERMAPNPDPRRDVTEKRRSEQSDTVQERVRELSWALLDQYASDDDISLLDSLLLADDEARKIYLECVQMHSDLMIHFARDNDGATTAPTGGPAVPGFLHSTPPAIGGASQVVEE
jgi:hypothetical protein